MRRSTMSDLLILGARGQVGRALIAHANRRGFRHRALGRAECDVCDRDAVRRAITCARLVVNCAAYTAVDRAETEPDAALRVNAHGAENIAAACTEAAIPLIHLSTDYVFDGCSARPAREDDPTRPLSVYGRTKLGGEVAVRRHLRSHIILRSSWIFSASGENFVKTILRLAKTRPELRIVDDQVGGPTAADHVAQAVIDIAAISAKPGFNDWGTYHFSGAPATSRYEFARAIAANDGAVVLPIATKDFPTPAQRPLNSVLDCSRIFRTFGIKQPDWREPLRDVLAALSTSA
jgi:dTDP-4-dehydrorhamnose reductase